nr:MAG TPA: hypothetical protein [Caudoviricetes sp.]
MIFMFRITADQSIAMIPGLSTEDAKSYLIRLFVCQMEVD